MAKKSENVKLAELAARQDNIKMAVDAVKSVLQNKLIMGLAGYAAVSYASTFTNSEGEPLMGVNTVSALKGVSAGYILGGWPGLALGTSVGISESLATNPITLSGVTNFFSGVGGGILKQLVGVPGLP